MTRYLIISLVALAVFVAAACSSHEYSEGEALALAQEWVKENYEACGTARDLSWSEEPTERGVWEITVGVEGHLQAVVEKLEKSSPDKWKLTSYQDGLVKVFEGTNSILEVERAGYVMEAELRGAHSQGDEKYQWHSYTYTSDCVTGGTDTEYSGSDWGPKETD